MPRPIGKAGRKSRHPKLGPSKTRRVNTRHSARATGVHNVQWGKIPGTPGVTQYAGEQGWLPPKPGSKNPQDSNGGYKTRARIKSKRQRLKARKTK